MNTRDFKKLEKQFEELLKKPLTSFTLGSSNKEALNTNDSLTSLLKTKIKEQRVLELKEDTTLEIKESGFLTINITNSLTLKLITKQENIAPFITINVENNVEATLLDYLKAPNSFKSLSINLKDYSTIKHSQIHLGAALNKNSISLEKGANYILKSSYFTNNEQSVLLNNITHLKEHSKSNLISNGAAINGAKVINDGIINITQEAPNSSGHQHMQNLLLDQSSFIQSEPILEINNNNVICSHGSSISQVSDEILFYMKSRGISKEDAINLLIQGFFESALELIEDKEDVQKLLKNDLTL